MHPRRAFVQVLVCIGLLLTACSGRPATPAATPAQPTVAAPTEQVVATPTPVAEPSPEPATVVGFEEGACVFDVPARLQAQCGYVIVPEDHSDPGGPAIRLAVAVFKSGSSARQADPVFVLAGGPGERAVEYAADLFDQWLPMVGERDLVVFDQRGAGLSEPALECPELVEAAYETLDEPDPDVSSRETYEGLMACRERLEQEGYNLSVYNTAQNAADVDAIRLALGYDQINLVGGSYGSMLAQAVMRDYPARIRSVVVNSVLPLEKSFYVDSVAVAPEAILRLLNACAADSACAAAYPDLEDVLYETIEQLNREPVPVTLTHPLTFETYDAVLTGDTVVGNLVLLLYWTEFIPSLPRAIYNVSQGDCRLMTQLFSLNLIAYDAVSQGMKFSVLCSEDLIGRTMEEYMDRMEALPEPLQGRESPESAAEHNPCAICEDWNVPQAGPSAKQPLASDIPTLILEGEFDPVTPPEYGELLAGHLPNSYLFTLPGAGHNVLTANECARELVGAFLDDPNRAPGASCIDEMTGVAFDVPGSIEVTLKPFVDSERRFKGLVPDGWVELGPGNLARGASFSDPTLFLLQAGQGTTSLFLTLFAEMFELDASAEPVRHATVGTFTWDFYEHELEGYPLDLALAEQGGNVYLVMMVSARDEREALYEQLFMPAVEAMAPLD
jgi:pimeloyl-ACP methyl ester carboxylesterase